MKHLRKLAAAAMLFFAGAPLCAAGPVQTMGFTEVNQGLPFIASKNLSQGVAGNDHHAQHDRARELDGFLRLAFDLQF